LFLGSTVGIDCFVLAITKPNLFQRRSKLEVLKTEWVFWWRFSEEYTVRSKHVQVMEERQEKDQSYIQTAISGNSGTNLADNKYFLSLIWNGFCLSGINYWIMGAW
jgi:hypothetical protein